MKKSGPKIKCLELPRASKKSSQAKPSFSKHLAHEPNFEPSLGSTHPYNLHINAYNMQYVNVENVHWNANIVFGYYTNIFLTKNKFLNKIYI